MLSEEREKGTTCGVRKGRIKDVRREKQQEQKKMGSEKGEKKGRDD